MSRYPNRFVRELAQWAHQDGWAWHLCGSGHVRWDHPDVPHPVFTPCTPRVNCGFKERQKLRTALIRAREAVCA